MSEQNQILDRHQLHDTQGAGAHGPSLNPSVSNLHSRLIAAEQEMGKLRASGVVAQPEQDYEIVDEPAGEVERIREQLKKLPEVPDNPGELSDRLDHVHNLVQEVRDHLDMDASGQPFQPGNIAEPVMEEKKKTPSLAEHLAEPLPDMYGKSLMEEEIPGQVARNRKLGQLLDEMDPWKNRSKTMRCRTCMWWVPKVALDKPDPGLLTHSQLGRCRRHSPTMNGYPATYDADWCGDHKLDETKL